MNIRILPEAERDLEIGADFYESQREGLGRYFNDCLSSDIEIFAVVCRHPREVARSFSLLIEEIPVCDLLCLC